MPIAIGVGIGIVFLEGVTGAQLAFTGSLTVEAGSAGPHFTLVVLNPPAGISYTFAEASDPDGVSTLSTDEVTISGALGAHSVSYSATPSDSPTHPTLTITLTVTIADTTAPVLSSPTSSVTGSTTATVGVTTNEGSSPDGAAGTLYCVVSTNATPPSAAQIIAGHDSSNAAGAFAANQSVSTTGAKTFSATGLTASTTYYAYFVQTDHAGNVSNVAAASSFTTNSSFTGLLDVLGVSAARAYSMRRLASAYIANKAIQIRRSSDNTTQDIGFDGSGNLDTSAITTFVGSNSAFITKWYDQSGNGDDLSQTTTANQPRIVNAGALDTKNSLPSAFFNGTSMYMAGSVSLAVGEAAAVAATALAGPNWDDFRSIISRAQGGAAGNIGIIGNSGAGGYYPSGLFSSNISVNNSTNATVFGGVLQQVDANIGTPGTWTDGPQIGFYPFFSTWSGNIAEVVVWSSQLSSGQRSTLYSNQKAYWGTP